MESAEAFVQLVADAWSFVTHYWPISVTVLAVAVAALTIRAPLRDTRFRRLLPRLAIPYAIPPLILLIGTLFRYELHGPPHPNWREPPAWYGYLLWGPVILHAALLVASVIVVKDARIRSAGVLLPGVWLSLCALFPAAFSVVGVGP